MLSLVFEGRKLRRRKTRSPSPHRGESSNHHQRGGSLSSFNPSDEDDGWCGLAGDLPLTFCGGLGGWDTHFLSSRVGGSVGLREVLRSSVQVLGMSGFGVTEKVVLNGGSAFTAKRFHRASVGRSEFGRRVERVAQVSGRCQYLVPVRAYLYAKRTKLVLCDYYPMGSLADLLAGARELGHTPLDWHKRARILLHVARAIAYIHSQPPAQDKQINMNIHGNIKTSNVFIKTDFSASISDYGFAQLARPVEIHGNVRLRKQPPVTDESTGKLSQKSDVFSFGVMALDLLGGARAPNQIHCIVERMEEIKEGTAHFFEYFVEGRAKKQALQMLEVALACTKPSPDARPTADQILALFRDALAVG